MIEQLQITNYKSIAELKIVCKKINVFIGEPNSGKSNIIEALALMSSDAIGTKLNRDLFRYKTEVICF
jgi:AAA15 family ATPase/GTPase